MGRLAKNKNYERKRGTIGCNLEGCFTNSRCGKEICKGRLFCCL